MTVLHHHQLFNGRFKKHFFKRTINFLKEFCTFFKHLYLVILSSISSYIDLYGISSKYVLGVTLETHNILINGLALRHDGSFFLYWNILFKFIHKSLSLLYLHVSVFFTAFFSISVSILSYLTWRSAYLAAFFF